MSKQLAAHNSACNDMYLEYQECEKQYPIGKYFGYCDAVHKTLTNCIKEQRTIQQKRSFEAYKARLERRYSEHSTKKET
ncbi:hypothetical protein KPH14_004962 [Odynerus spinipes]|uniref:COX assembly mitochondrial protein n=1 Tax=Odynerus spinipes TaxID=1348599 RepID=A0AAD9RN74_9HYME|nr:hypothetical protein KPH14_004962 [Odynerus spinipes]